MTTRSFLVTILVRETPFFSDETRSRHHFGAGNSIFWRRDPFSSSFLSGKLYFLATKPLLVVILNRETLLFGGETRSRHHFEPRNFIF
ncbi:MULTISPECIES: hypothetical protein [Bacillaceae]|uniref:hypothetical protein n=1 Tax=Bacillaceae TaxID=186817 RepID=UPI001269F3C4|nr:MULTISPECIES: hypothetical protein [Bacillaceae]MEC5271269.1 hypothetical protein [Caldifermentibacillus hisashii]